MELRRRMFGVGSSILPSGYTQVEYIENTSNAYINTGYALDFTETIECKFNILEPVYNSRSCVFGTWSSLGANCTRIMTATSLNEECAANYNTNSFGSSNAVMPYLVLTDYTISMNELGCTVNGIYYQFNLTGKGTENNNNMFLFSQNGTAQAMIGRMYYFRMDGKVNMIPCISPDNVVGMYDTIRNQFFQALTTRHLLQGQLQE